MLTWIVAADWRRRDGDIGINSLLSNFCPDFGQTQPTNRPARVRFPTTESASWSVGGFLFSKISESPIVHVPKLFPLLHWFQNTFCFLCSSTPSHAGNHFKCSWGYSWGNFQKSISGHNFWLEWPTDVRSTPLSYIFNALFRDTPLDHVFCAQPNSQIAKYPNIWLIWLFGYLAACKKHGQVGYPWKEH